ncbi:hypothetical protein Lepto7375DRAFT_0509 [Leptolyngbya sp. PCC 7375]|nr:hypothetical protein Lepto7375DRAFT_0509 [Leptolyngbya sp. PCC 7375]
MRTMPLDLLPNLMQERTESIIQAIDAKILAAAQFPVSQTKEVHGNSPHHSP